jgi:tRNA nucleotidyltransferase (CCA-adding enzyme)
MKTYLVGGAVRDKLLGFEKSDRDWVVVGASVAQMLDAGFTQVGKDFPVFLHPQTKEEHALARTERKTGPGYTGFAFNADPSVTLEEDLLRRDLTINAIAQDSDGNLIDPYGGVKDIEDRVLRHVSPAFTEDPLRVLRVARFEARFAPLGFHIAEETMALMRQLSSSGELQHLVAERVWQEMEKALRTAAPAEFFSSLRACGALQVILPEVDNLFGVPQPPQHHPEVDTGIHVMMCLEQAAKLSDDTVVRFATLMHDVGKGMTPKDKWPHHYGHEQLGVPLIDAVCARLRVPKKYQQLARQVSQFHTHCHRAQELRADTMLRLFESLDAFRRPTQVAQFLLACEADSRGRTGFEDREYPQAQILRGALIAAQAVDIKAVLQDLKPAGDKPNDAIKAAIARARTAAIAKAIGKTV